MVSASATSTAMVVATSCSDTAGWKHPLTRHGQWLNHPEFELTWASIPIIVAAVNGDGLSDLIVGNAHGYGLDWLEQRFDAQRARSWLRHPIDPFNAQYHDLHWVDIDIDGDGGNVLVTGKRYRAHPNRHDPGADDDLGIYYLKRLPCGDRTTPHENAVDWPYGWYEVAHSLVP